MADMIDLTSYSNIVSDIFDVLIYVLVAAIILGVILFIVFIVKHKYYITVKQLTGGKKLIIQDRARIVKDKKGVQKLKLFKLKERITFPPDEAVDLTKRGKIFAECYRTQNGQYIWIIDKGIQDPKDVKIPDGKTAEEYEAMNTTDRDFYANEWEESERYSKNRIWQNLPQIVALLVPLVIFILVVIYWEELANPNIEMAQRNEDLLAKSEEILGQANLLLARLDGQRVISENEPIPKEAGTGG